MAIRNSTAPEYGWFAFIVPNIGVAKEIESWVRSLKGVKFANAKVIEGFINLIGEAFEDELEKEKALLVLAGS